MAAQFLICEVFYIIKIKFEKVTKIRIVNIKTRTHEQKGLLLCSNKIEQWSVLLYYRAYAIIIIFVNQFHV